MATAISSALLNAEMNKGMKIGMSALTLDFSLPVIKVEPLALCAFMIFSVSSISVGMNLRLIEIIIASSCIGTLISLIGAPRFSMASVSSIGLVVRVRIVVMINSITRRIVMYMPVMT